VRLGISHGKASYLSDENREVGKVGAKGQFSNLRSRNSDLNFEQESAEGTEVRKTNVDVESEAEMAGLRNTQKPRASGE
jgi:hypothetical protein